MTFALNFPKLLQQQKTLKMQPIICVQQNTVCLEQHTYASQENFTQHMIVMIETLRRPACSYWKVSLLLCLYIKGEEIPTADFLKANSLAQ